VSDYVLDASALLALVHGEPGAERVRAALGQAVISAINLAEVVGRLASTALTADRAWTRLGTDVRIELLRPS
jgi:ribonuclease VapC